jgi:hypothetical protein
MKKHSMALFALALGTALSAPAATIFGDDFERAISNSVGAGWTEDESDAVDVSVVSRSSGGQEMQLRDDDPLAIASQLGGISTMGYANITLSYDWAPTNNTESGDFLWVEWRNGSVGSWAEIAHHALSGPGAHQFASWNIAAAGGLDDFEFRFRVAVDANNEGATIDNVLLAGNPVLASPINNVAEPGSLALAGLGLGLLAFLARRKVAEG